MSLSAGQKISSYKIVAPLGEGAMGEVYRARDTRLEREVAIKVLPASWCGDADRVARFSREARTLAALNHPAVAQIYSVDELEGVHFIVLELVEGEDLATLLQRGPLSIDDTVSIARQIADGLEAAHEVGVVHRDLKPANVRVTHEGRAKILDFGLAKPLLNPNTHDTTITSPDRVLHTEEGLLLGTPAYMSPEQARGQPVDRRTDIWAYGCVLYECLTGEAPFQAATFTDTLAAVVEKDPDLDRLPARTPRHVRRLIARCLDKNPRTRLRDIGEARVILDPATAEAESESSPTPARSGTLAWVVVVIISAALIPVLFMYSMSGSPPRTSVLANARSTTIAGFPGTEVDATISRDGSLIAFVSDRDGPFDVLVGQVGGGDYHNRTNGRIPVWWLKVRDIGFSLDGTEIWLSGGNEHRRMQWVPVMGIPVLRNNFSDEVVNLDWSPDEKRLVYHESSDGDPLFVADADGSNPVMIRVGERGGHQHHPMWSFDGEWIFFSGGVPATGDMHLWRMRPDGTDAEQLTDDKWEVGYPTPIDERTLLYVAKELDGAGPWLWEMDLDTLTSRRAGLGVQQCHSASASEDGRRLVLTVASPTAHLWSVPILGDRVATDEDAEQLTGFPTGRALSPRFSPVDAGKLFYRSSRGVTDGLWLRQGDEHRELLKGTQYALQEPAAVSPDGQWLAVLLRRHGRLHVYRVSADGAEMHPLSGAVDARGAACWAPDGQSVVVGGIDDDGKGLFRLPVDGGAPERLAIGDALNPVWSSSQDLIVYMGPQITATHRLMALRPSNRELVEIPNIQVTRDGDRIRFLPDGSGLVYTQGAPAKDFHVLDLATRKTRALAQFQDQSVVRSFDISPDGQRIVFDRHRANSDVVIIDLQPQR